MNLKHVSEILTNAKQIHEITELTRKKQHWSDAQFTKRSQFDPSKHVEQSLNSYQKSVVDLKLTHQNSQQ